MKKQRFFAFVIMTMIITLLFTGCMVQAEVPQIKEGRFAISVTYEVNGEETTYSDVYVCKYTGVSVGLDGEYSRKWEGHLEKNNDERGLAIQTNDDGIIYLSFYLNPDYFMSDPDFEIGGFDIPEPYLILAYHSDDPTTTTMTTEVDFMGKYGVRLIDYAYASPIENSFVEQWGFATLDPNIN
jgi:hypothetical protein